MTLTLSGFIPYSSRSRKEEKKENEFDEKKCIRSRRTFFLIFDVCDMFFLSLFSLSLSSIGEGTLSSRDLVFVRILVGRRSFFVGACRGEKGGQKKERPVYLLVPGHSLTPPYS